MPTIKQLRAFMKVPAERFYIKGAAPFDRPSWSSNMAYKLHTSTDRWIDIPGLCMGEYLPSNGYWSLFAAEHRIRAAIQFAPADATVRFIIRLDWLTTERMRTLGLHGDALILEIQSSKGEFDHLIDTAVGPHDLGRFGS